MPFEVIDLYPPYEVEVTDDHIVRIRGPHTRLDGPKVYLKFTDEFDLGDFRNAISKLKFKEMVTTIRERKIISE